ncbi:unnamed protein product [Diatraea saccharalis]|uniref:F-box domain-containing protein n=1 Tax=Diatraea saccharalis TaxID=40085 RepID=A0A9N9QYN1_9NEOP|nr:unnamed protein product [Diatraea saccharalis]
MNVFLINHKENDEESAAAEKLKFNRHLLSTVHWFARISCANKKRYLMALLNNMQSAWALSLLLKSIWNCRPKDAVLSASDPNVWSSYDQTPLDHNRTAQPAATLALVMKSDRVWFLSLEPESQAIVLSELLAVSGGPVMWEVLTQAEKIYDRYRVNQMLDLEECIVVNDTHVDKTPPPPVADKSKKDISSQQQKTVIDKTIPTPGHAQKELEANLAIWNSTIKALRDSVKLEEFEMKFKDGTKRKVWKVNRPKPEIIETVDFVQLLPAAIGKCILSYLPRANLAEYAKVNKYWAYLVDDFKAELLARAKIDSDLNKLQELMLRHDTSMEVLIQPDFKSNILSSQGVTSAAPSARARQFVPSMRPSERSAGAVSFRHMLIDKLAKTSVVQKPFRNLAELTQRLETRGAADENLAAWCNNLVKQIRTSKKMGKASLSLYFSYTIVKNKYENADSYLDFLYSLYPFICDKENISILPIAATPPWQAGFVRVKWLY